jgi:hypothetical protein
MISPQEPGQPDDAAHYSWTPHGPYAYWAARIGKDIADAIEQAGISPIPRDVLNETNNKPNFYDGLIHAQIIALRFATDYNKGKKND